MSNVVKRVLTAVVVGTPLFFFILLGPPWTFYLLILGVALVCIAEYNSLWAQQENALLKGLSVVLTAAIVTCAHFWPTGMPAVLAAVVLLMFFYYLALPGLGGGSPGADGEDSAAEFQNRGELMARWSLSVAGVLYVGMLLGHLVLIRQSCNAHWILTLLFSVWFGDTAAYFVGRAVGRHKLYPRVSPGKTIEGALGGLVGSTAGVVLGKLLWLHQLTVLDCLLMGVLVAVFGQVGDLCESALKRSAQVKDSGNILPGHGGLLDRVDALMFAAPVMYVYHWVRFG